MRIGLTISRKGVLAGCGLVALAVAVGVSRAGIPDSSGTLHGCYSANGAKGTNGTQLNIIDSASASCSKGQQSVTWNALSPNSFAGSDQSCPADQYATGIDSSGNLNCAALPQQLPHLYEAKSQDVVDFSNGTKTATLATLTVPTSATYFVTAKVSITAGDTGDTMWCYLYDGGTVVDSEYLEVEGYGLTTPNTDTLFVPLQGKGNGGTLSVYCSSDDDNGALLTAKIDAVQVASS